MTCCINTISTDEFRALFKKDFPYLPIYINGKAYFTDDEVYYEGNFYKSLKDGNLTVPTTVDNWTLTNDSEDNYISDTDIERAFEEAKSVFPASIFHGCNTVRMIYLYLAAHFLVIDINNAQNPFIMGYIGMTQSKSVGSVSESYGIPAWVQNDLQLGAYAQTGFGRKYLQLMLPYRKAAAMPMLFKGRTTLG